MPQFIKAAVVSRAIADTEGITEVLVHTDQHYDSKMSDVFFDELDIPSPHFSRYLSIGAGNNPKYFPMLFFVSFRKFSLINDYDSAA